MMMNSNSSVSDAGDTPSEVLVVRAMDRVLEAERAAQAAIAECERECEEMLEHSRERRRAILERAHARIVALHTRAAKALELRTAEFVAQRGKSAATTAQPADPARFSDSLERLATQLTGSTSKRHHGG
jgi:vacuolar-type H+-ATPase subunit H